MSYTKMVKYNFRETYLNESFFDDIEDDLDNKDTAITKGINDILFNNRLIIESTLDKVQLVPNFSNKYVYNVKPNEKTELNISKLLNNCTNLSQFLKEINQDVKYLQFQNCDFSHVTDMSKMFCLVYLDTIEFVGELLNTYNVTNMHDMFYATNVTTLDLSLFDTSNVKDMSSMFEACDKLKNINLRSFDTSNVKDMSRMFNQCKKLTKLNLSSFNTFNVIDMDGMFYNNKSLGRLDLSSFNTSNVTTMYGMFEQCTKIKKIINNFDTSNVKTMTSMFRFCRSLEAIDCSSFNTSNLQYMQEMFAGCMKIKSLDLSNFNTSNVNNMESLFAGCSELTYLDISNFSIKHSTSITNMFANCNSLKTIKCKPKVKELLIKNKSIVKLPNNVTFI